MADQVKVEKGTPVAPPVKRNRVTRSYDVYAESQNELGTQSWVRLDGANAITPEAALEVVLDAKVNESTTAETFLVVEREKSVVLKPETEVKRRIVRA